MQITMNRGDIKWIRFSVRTPDGAPLPFDLNDVRFTVKSSTLSTSAAFQKSVAGGQIKRIPNGDYQFKINPRDTRALAYGLYKFDFQIYCGSALKETFIGDLRIEHEVTRPDYDYDDSDDQEFEFEVPDNDGENVLSLETSTYFTLSLKAPVTVHTSPDYRLLFNKPAINGVTLDGDISLDELGLTFDVINDMEPLTDAEIDTILTGGVLGA